MQQVQRKFIRLFVCAAATVLLTTGFAKLISSMGEARILDGPDPIFGMEIRTVFVAAAFIEIAAAVVCLRNMAPLFQIYTIAWISTVFLLYRLGLWIVGSNEACGCLGSITHALHISPQSADLGMKLVLGCLLIGSYAGVLWLRWQPPSDAGA